MSRKSSVAVGIGSHSSTPNVSANTSTSHIGLPPLRPVASSARDTGPYARTAAPVRVRLFRLALRRIGSLPGFTDVDRDRTAVGSVSHADQLLSRALTRASDASLTSPINAPVSTRST
jgi:hypothetical protein